MVSLIFIVKSSIIKSLSLFVRLIDLFIPKNNKLIVLGAPDFGDNSYYMFKSIKEDINSKYNVIWLTKSNTLIAEINKKWGFGSAYNLLTFSGISKFLRARVVVVNHGASDVLYYIGNNNYRKFIINLWHGIPTKKPTGLMSNAKMLWDLMPVCSETEKQLLVNYNINCQLPIVGTPRSEYFFKVDDNEIERIKLIFKKYINFDPSIIITYAPTYRHHIGTNFFPFDDYNVDELINYCEEKNIVIILRIHPNEIGELSNDKLDKLLDSNNIILGNRDRFRRMQELLLITDFLITDYSSSYFDLLIAKRPTIFFPYDKEEYNQMYGFAMDFDTYSSKTSCYTQDEFFKLLDKLIENPKIFSSWLDKEFSIYHQYDINNCVNNLLKAIEKSI